MNKSNWTFIKVMFGTFALGLSLCLMNVPANAETGARQDSTQLHRRGSSYDRDSHTQALLAEQVRHKLAMLPWYNVFDWLEGYVTPEGEVTLRGEVVKPVTKSDALSSVKHIEGVTQVNNQIEVLPLSPFDDRIRLRVYRSIFNFNSPLFRYSEGSVPPIHIIVRNGHVTLKGVVANDTDSQIAYMRANGVPGVFSVSNQLQVEQSRHRNG
ncbi:MAG: BON domain-containing protein [Acidobacteriia bacterium]|nr:BON domain-containing protein [Terriglobia bacterium]